MSVNQNQPKTREQVKKERKRQQQREKRVRARKFPLEARIFLLFAVVIVCLLAGVVFGYGFLGHGNPGDALKESTWTHIRDLVSKKR